MRIVALLILIFGAALAGGAVFIASNHYEQLLAQQQRQAAAVQPAAPVIKTTPVLVATTALRYGTVLNESHLKIIEFPEGSAPPNSFREIGEVLGGAEQRVVLRSIEPNEPILKNKITGYGEDATMAGQLTPGMRAYTLRIDTVSGVAGFLLPNDRVDIFLTRGGGNNLTANLIMQNVRVIAIDQFSDQEANQARVARTATVEVTPEDAQRLALAQQVGRISLSLRQIDDAAPMTGEDEKAPVISLGDIIPQEEVEQAAPARQVCVRKGVNVVCSPAGAAPAPAPAAAPETPATPTE